MNKNRGYSKAVLELVLIIGLAFGVMSSGAAYASDPVSSEAGSYVPDCSQGDSYLPDPYDCKMFYQCVNEKPIHLYCSPGTEFDKSLNVCNLPEQASCVAIPKPSQVFQQN
jgi:hypothetical protein